jgi:hypothetical protein
MNLELEHSLLGTIERLQPEHTYVEVRVRHADIASDVGYGTRISELINFLNHELNLRGCAHRVVPDTWDVKWDSVHHLRLRLRLRDAGLGDLMGLPVRAEQ